MNVWKFEGENFDEHDGISTSRGWTINLLGVLYQKRFPRNPSSEIPEQTHHRSLKKGKTRTRDKQQ